MERYLTLVTIVTWSAVTIQRVNWQRSSRSYQQPEREINAPVAKFGKGAGHADIPAWYSQFKTHNAAACRKTIYEIARRGIPKMIKNCRNVCIKDPAT